MIRTLSHPNYATTAYRPGDAPRLITEPVYICDSRLLCTMMLSAWNPDAARDMRRGLYREIYGTEPVRAETADGSVTLTTTDPVIRMP